MVLVRLERMLIRTQSSARAETDQTNSVFILSTQYLWRVRETVGGVREVEETYTVVEFCLGVSMAQNWPSTTLMRKVGAEGYT